jgi:ATP-binding cassette subfamily B protein
MPSKTVSADSGSLLSTLANLWPYIWPSSRPDLKARVAIAGVFLLLAEVVLVLVPFFYKWATNTLSGSSALPAYLPAFLAAPLMLVVAYNLMRITNIGLEQFNSALFARVGQNAVRQLAHRTFVHMHSLSLRFHLERKTGGLSRIIERGVKGIEAIVRLALLSAVPTVIEFSLVAIIFALNYGWQYVAIMAVTVWLYVWFTIKASDWRIHIRRQMNESDTEANTKAIDSLLNFETVNISTTRRWRHAASTLPWRGTRRRPPGPGPPLAGLILARA